jgi:hypothetical protein
MINKIGTTSLRFSSYCDNDYYACVDQLVAQINSSNKTSDTTQKVYSEFDRMDVLISRGAESWRNYCPRNYATNLEVAE